MNSKSGIYAITNIVNGHRYIGSAMNIAKRWTKHRVDLRRSVHDNRHLQRAWDKYGKDAFRFEILEECEICQLIEREQWWLDVAQPEYNICTVAGSALGTKHSEKTRAKISVANKGKKVSAETRAKISAANKGKTRSPEARARSAAAQIGRKHSAETRAKMSVALMGNSRNKGKKFTKEHRAKMSAAAKGNHRALGHKMSVETRAKISAAKRAYWAAKRACVECGG